MSEQRLPFRDRLSGGTRQSIGEARAVAADVLRFPEGFEELFDCLFDEDAIVRGRAANALLQVAAGRPAWFAPYKDIMLAEVARIPQWEVREQFCKIIVRQSLTRRERTRVFEIFVSYLEDRSSIVRTCALQGLHDLAFQHPEWKPEVIDLIQEKTRTGTAAMRARGKALLANLYKHLDEN